MCLFTSQPILLSKYPFDNLINCLRWNLMAVLSLFEQARIAGISRFIVAGSYFE